MFKFKMDFCEIFPPELSNKLFKYVSDRDLYSCACCSLLWREIINNDSQWKSRCYRKKWCSLGSNSNIKLLETWNEKKSHVAPDEIYRFRASPVYASPSPCVSQNISPLCEWAIYYRKRSHLSRNWHKGVYKITKLHFPAAGGDAFSYHLVNDAYCDGSLLVAGTHRGHVLMWEVEGIPKFVTSIPPHHSGLEVETVKLVASKYLVVLYQTGEINVFSISKDHTTSPNFTLQPVYQVKVVGVDFSDEDGSYDLECQQEYLSQDILYSNDSLETDDPNSEVRYLFQPQLRRARQLLEDIGVMLFSSESHIILTAFSCKCFMMWDILTHSPKKFSLRPQGYCVSQKGYMSSRKMYFLLHQHGRAGTQPQGLYCISIYDLSSISLHSEPPPEIVIPCSSEVEEIRPDSQDERIVYSTTDLKLFGMNIIKNEILFCNEIPHSIEYILVSDEIIVYEDSNGMHVGLNWVGDPLYIIEGDFGKVIGLRKVSESILVSGGTSRQLSVWDFKSGEKLHTVYHQPCMINYIYADDTKIVTIGKEDEPVVVGYW